MTNTETSPHEQHKTRITSLLFVPLLVSNAPFAISLELNPWQLFKDLIGAIIDALVDIVGTAISPLVEGLVSMLVVSYTWVPAPGVEPLETPVTQPWPGIMELAGVFKTVAIFILFIGFIVYLASSALGHGFGNRGKGFVKRSLLVFPLLFFMDLWAWMLIFVMKIVNVTTQAIMPPQAVVTEAVSTVIVGIIGPVTGAVAYTGGGAVPVALGLFFVSLLGFVAFLFIGIVRVIGLTLMIAIFPLSLVLWTFGGIDYLEQIGEMGSKGMQWFLAFAFFPIPAAVSIALGTHLLQANALKALAGTSGLAGFGGAIVSLFVGVTVFAFGPWFAVKMTKPGAAAIDTAAQVGSMAAGAYVGGATGAAKAGSSSFRRYAGIKDSVDGATGPGEDFASGVQQPFNDKAFEPIAERANQYAIGPTKSAGSTLKSGASTMYDRVTPTPTLSQETLDEADEQRERMFPSERNRVEPEVIGVSSGGVSSVEDLNQPAFDGVVPGEQPGLPEGDTRQPKDTVVTNEPDSHTVAPGAESGIRSEVSANNVQDKMPNFMKVAQEVHRTKRHNIEDIVEGTSGGNEPGVTDMVQDDGVFRRVDEVKDSDDRDDRDLDFSGVDIEGADPDGDTGNNGGDGPERTI